MSHRNAAAALQTLPPQDNSKLLETISSGAIGPFFIAASPGDDPRYNAVKKLAGILTPLSRFLDLAEKDQDLKKRPELYEPIVSFMKSLWVAGFSYKGTPYWVEGTGPDETQWAKILNDSVACGKPLFSYRKSLMERYKRFSDPVKGHPSDAAGVMAELKELDKRLKSYREAWRYLNETVKAPRA